MKIMHYPSMKKLLQFYQKFKQKSSQNRSTSVQNRPKICPKSIPDGPKSVQNRLPGPSLGPKTGKTGKEISKKTQRQHKTPGVPTLSAFPGQKYRQHGPNLAAQNEPKSLKNPSKNRSNFELLLGSSLDTKIVPKTTPKVIKNRSKIDLKNDHSTKTRILVLTHKNQWFLHIFQSPGGRKAINNQQKIILKAILS